MLVRSYWWQLEESWDLCGEDREKEVQRVEDIIVEMPAFIDEKGGWEGPGGWTEGEKEGTLILGTGRRRHFREEGLVKKFTQNNSNNSNFISLQRFCPQKAKWSHLYFEMILATRIRLREKLTSRWPVRNSGNNSPKALNHLPSQTEKNGFHLEKELSILFFALKNEVSEILII